MLEQDFQSLSETAFSLSLSALCTSAPCLPQTPPVEPAGHQNNFLKCHLDIKKYLQLCNPGINLGGSKGTNLKNNINNITAADTVISLQCDMLQDNKEKKVNPLQATEFVHKVISPQLTSSALTYL